MSGGNETELTSHFSPPRCQIFMGVGQLKVDIVAQLGAKIPILLIVSILQSS